MTTFPFYDVIFRVDRFNTVTGVTNTQHAAKVTLTVAQVPTSGCKVYVSALPDPALQCGNSCNSVGNPINPASGAKHQTETDWIGQPGTFEFKRFYSNLGEGTSGLSTGWRHSFSRAIRPVYSNSMHRPYVSSPDNSSQYTEEALACTSGFSQIKSRVNAWTSATAAYTDGVCKLSVGTTLIGHLPILYTAQPTPAPGTATIIGLDAVRDDGQVVRFMMDGSSFSTQPGSQLRLAQTSGGHVVNDANDNVEVYDTNGRLITVTDRSGVASTMSYDPSDRLGTVTNSFGHGITLTYDTQGRLSAVTRQ